MDEPTLVVRVTPEHAPGDVVIVTADPEQAYRVELRIGEVAGGGTRYVELTRSQALTIARALNAAARVTD